MAKVLVVDSDEDFRESVKLVLERARHEALVFSDAREALPLANASVRVLVDDEAPALAATFAASGARVIAVKKPTAPAILLAAIDPADAPN